MRSNNSVHFENKSDRKGPRSMQQYGAANHQQDQITTLEISLKWSLYEGIICHRCMLVSAPSTPAHNRRLRDGILCCRCLSCGKHARGRRRREVAPLIKGDNLPPLSCCLQPPPPPPPLHRPSLMASRCNLTASSLINLASPL